MNQLAESLQGLGPFLICMLGSFVALLIFKWIYALLTPHDEWVLIKEDNTAAAVGFGGAIIGFAIALSSAIEHSIGVVDFLIWTIIALLTQLIAFATLRFVFMPSLVKRIKDNSIAAAVILASFAIAVGLLNAASMSV